MGGFSLSGASHCRVRLLFGGRLAIGRERLTVRRNLLLGCFSIPLGKAVVTSEQHMSLVMCSAPRSWNCCLWGRARHKLPL